MGQREKGPSDLWEWLYGDYVQGNSQKGKDSIEQRGIKY